MIAVLDKDNKVISLPGGSAPTYNDGVLIAPEYDQKTFYNPHDVCVDNDGNLYVRNGILTKPTPLSYIGYS